MVGMVGIPVDLAVSIRTSIYAVKFFSLTVCSSVVCIRIPLD
jgi:hypothetical protein